MTSSRKTLLTGAALSTVALVSAGVASAAPASTGAKLVVFYKTPADEKAFEKYYFGTHAPLASKLPGLRSYIVSTTPVAGADGKPSAVYSFFAELTFDSLAALGAALGSTQGGIVVGDLKNFAQAGTDITVFETKALV